MKSDSWAAYRAAAPLECHGEPDDESPRHHAPPNCGRCGKFVDTKPGSGARFDFTQNSMFSAATAEWLCPGCAAKTPLPPTDDEVKEAERLTDEAYTRAMVEEANAEAAARAGCCDYCGAKLPNTGTAGGICAACEASVNADAEPFDSDDIPW